MPLRSILFHPTLADSLSHQPPNSHTRIPVGDEELTLKLKYRVQTIFISAKPNWTFEKLTAELLKALREQYPNGLRALPGKGPSTPIPSPNTAFKVAYALPKNPNDLENGGWNTLNVEDEDTLDKLRLPDFSVLAFKFVYPDATQNGSVEGTTFDVKVPVLLDDEE